ncbi:MAG: dITP/XTP pyrophosphatase [Candidatus Peregrinibacteria bacterium Gr01-1014_25]|nr:MAG: dITP/XTP pyrophosphatase [Candidatus Peregrinibacteria bacterium Gr01-1014_25]
MELLLATTNSGKAVEMRSALLGLPLGLRDLSMFPSIPRADESGATFSANAAAKAFHYHGHTRLPTVADDSGIIVEALANELGIHTRRWGAGEAATDAEWIAHFLKRMEREANRRARFVCALAFIDDAGRTHHFEGVCDGEITATLEAPIHPGLPLSSCFRPDSHVAVYSALKPEQKNSTSHRGKALLAFRAFLEETLLKPSAPITTG